MIWIWHSEGDNWFFDSEKPVRLVEDRYWLKLKAGDLMPGFGTVVSTMPQGLLPADGELLELDFQILWDKAASLNGYNEEEWKLLAKALGIRRTP